MRPIKYGYIAVAVLMAGVFVLAFIGRPERLPEEEREIRSRVALRLARLHADEVTEEVAGADEDAQQEATEPEQEPTEKEDDMWPEEAPDVFKVKFKCTNGEFIVECQKKWAPLGAERFYQLVREGFFDDSAFFRVVPGFVVQFGLAGDPEVTAKWREKRLQDDPVTQSNEPGTLTFATSGPNSRTTQLFINLGANAGLDNMGFAPFGKVIEGMDVVREINPEYGERPNQGMITRDGNSYLRKNFPNITIIEQATLIK